MEIKISVFKFIEILEELNKKISINLKSDNSLPNENQLNNESESHDNFLSGNRQKDFYNMSNTENIFTKEFNNFHLLKNEKRSALNNHIDENSELYYINSNNLTKLDIKNRQILFHDLFSRWLDNLKKSIKEKQNQFLTRGILINNSIITDYKFLNFNTKSEFEQFLRKNGKLITQIENFSGDKYLFKFFKELYICLKLNRNLIISDNFSINSITNDLDERMNLIFYEIGKKNYFEEDFELHKAVYENNLRMIRKICAMEITSHLHCEINEMDPHGNTPLMLAIKLKNLDVINVLCDHEADIKHKCYDGDISPIEYAVSTKNKEILKILINGVKKQKISNWESNKKEIMDLIKNIPDFSMELKLNFDSNFFSLFTSITPNDTYKIYKSHGNLRIDLNISALNYSFKSIRGKCSIIVQEKDNKINVFKVDHDKKVSYDYIDYLSNTNDEDEKVERTILNGVNSKKIITKDFRYVEDKKKKEEKILNYIGVKHTLKGDVYMMKKKKKSDKKSEEREEDLYYYFFKKSGKTFSMYYIDGLDKRKRNSVRVEKMCEENNDENNKKLSNTSKILFKEKTQKILSTKILKKIDFNYPKEYMQTDGNLKIKVDKINSERNNRNESSFSLKSFKKKSVEMSMWISDSFPIKISHFIPLIHILSFASNEFSELKSALCSDFLPFNSFPLKICFPLGFSFFALLSVIGFKHQPPPDTIFDLPYSEKDNRANSLLRLGDQVELDKNYATDFYARYYLEQNMNGKGDFDDLDRSSSSNFERLREMFLTNQDECNNVDNNQDLNDELKDENLNKNDLDRINSNDLNLEEFEKISNNLSPVSNKITNINFTDVNFGFFNGELNFENGAVAEVENIQESANLMCLINSNNLMKTSKIKDKIFNKSFPYWIHPDDINEPISPLYNILFNEDLHISSERNIQTDKKIIIIPENPQNIKFCRFNPGRIHIQKKSQEFVDNFNKNKKTIKLGFQPVFTKKCRNSSKCQSNKNEDGNLNKPHEYSSNVYFTEECLIVKNTFSRNQIHENQNNVIRDTKGYDIKHQPKLVKDKMGSSKSLLVHDDKYKMEFFVDTKNSNELNRCAIF